MILLIDTGISPCVIFISLQLWHWENLSFDHILSIL